MVLRSNKSLFTVFTFSSMTSEFVGVFICTSYFSFLKYFILVIVLVFAFCDSPHCNTIASVWESEWTEQYCCIATLFQSHFCKVSHLTVLTYSKILSIVFCWNLKNWVQHNQTHFYSYEFLLFSTFVDVRVSIYLSCYLTIFKRLLVMREPRGSPSLWESQTSCRWNSPNK